jgi:hypothetical protein
MKVLAPICAAISGMVRPMGNFIDLHDDVRFAGDNRRILTRNASDKDHIRAGFVHLVNRGSSARYSLYEDNRLDGSGSDAISTVREMVVSISVENWSG